MTEQKHDDARGASRSDDVLGDEVERLTNKLAHLHCINGTLRTDAERYRWLRDNGHLNQWWSVQGPKDRCENIDADIDEAMKEAANAPGKPTAANELNKGENA